MLQVSAEGQPAPPAQPSEPSCQESTREAVPAKPAEPEVPADPATVFNGEAAVPVDAAEVQSEAAFDGVMLNGTFLG